MSSAPPPAKPAPRRSPLRRLLRILLLALDVARRAVTEMTVPERRGLDAYVDGVNAGLEALDARPFEYYLLGQRPESWEPADCYLVLCSMFLMLQDHDPVHESALGVLHDVMPPVLCDFLAPVGTEGDAPLEGGALPTPPIPGPDVFDLRSGSPAAGGRLRKNAGGRSPRA